jgi:2-polyprenyl-3-methyl-5-hydroxy-6-metoxy-1,4-benzoquinol methylase
MSLARRCPVCSSPRARPVWHEQRCRYVRCSSCGVIFSDVDAATYTAAGRNAWHEAELSSKTQSFYGVARELTHRRFLQRFRPWGASRLLDVGCGLGYFVARASSIGWDAYGCDTSEYWSKHAAGVTGMPERIACSGPRTGLFGGGFDLITVWDVLEHIHDPLPFLRTIADLLAPGGRIFIRTPNIAWVYPTYAVRRHLLRSDVTLGPLNHVVYYSSATLCAALRAAELRPVAGMVLPPPQVGIANRRPQADRRSAATRLKNLHAAGANLIARPSRGHLALGADLDLVAARA